jgi:two-component system KDP operon response regulator KdpE
MVMKPDQPCVMLIDDEPDFHRFFRKSLRGVASQLLHAMEPSAGIRMIVEKKPDVVFLDLHFDGSLSGPRVLKLARDVAKAHHPGLTIYTFSAYYRSPNDLLGLYCGGADGCFSKALEMPLIRQAVQVVSRFQRLRMRADECGCGRDISAGPMVLIISDDATTSTHLEAGFQREGFGVHAASFVEVGLAMAHALRPDVVLLDCDMAGDKCLDVLEILRQSPRTCGSLVAVIGSKNPSLWQVSCLRAGASMIFPKKGFDLDAIPLEIKNRMVGSIFRGRKTMTVGKASLSLSDRRVCVEGLDVHLTPMESRLLAFLMENCSRVVGWVEMEQKLWGWEPQQLTQKEPGAIHQVLTSLRKKLGVAADQLQVHRGHGVRFS